MIPGGGKINEIIYWAPVLTFLVAVLIMIRNLAHLL